MHITELRVAGFKSFVDPTLVRVEPGLTGVVGPNGCGKSNLLEALRWVMGANSAKAMRGVDMDDVIFAGTSARAARESAEVTMVLDNAFGRAPAPLHEADRLEVTRRIRRGTGSDYRLNGRPARAKDIQLLFADASTGANSPALVRQGQIAELISARPQNRRRILEEAAGVAGLAQRRHEADLKLQAASDNLVRLADVLVHAEARLEDLRKQARRAERFRGLAAQIDGLDALLRLRRFEAAAADHTAAEAELATARAALADATGAEAAARTAELDARAALDPLHAQELSASGRVRELEAARIEQARDLREAEDTVRRLEADLQRLVADLAREQSLREDADRALGQIDHDLANLPDTDAEAEQAETDRLRAGLAAARAALANAETALEAATREAAGGQARFEAAQTAAEAARSRFSVLDGRLGALRRELAARPPLAGLEDALAAAQAQAASARGDLTQARAAVEAAEAALSTARTAESTARAGLGNPQTRLRSLEGELSGLERLLRAGANPPRFPKVLNALHPAPGYERALAAALGDDVEASLDREAPSAWLGANAQDGALPDGAEPLLPHVQAPGALAARLAQCGVVAQADGPRLQGSLLRGQRLVSREGDLWRWDGFVRRAEAAPQAAVLLEQRNRRTELLAEIEDARTAASAAEAAHRSAEAARTTAEASSRTARRTVEDATLALSRATERAGQAERALATAAAGRAGLEAQVNQLAADHAEAAEAKAKADAILATTPRPPPPEALATARRTVAEARGQEQTARDRLAQLDRERERRIGRRKGLERDRTGWARRAEDAARRVGELMAARTEQRAALDAARAAPVRVAEALTTLAAALTTAEADRRAATDAAHQGAARLREAETVARRAVQAVGEATTTLARLEARAENLAARYAEAALRVEEHPAGTPDALGTLVAAALGEEAATLDTAKAEGRLERLRRERDSLGGVDLDAAGEASTAEQRLVQLIAERDDLTAAIARLREGIEALNSEARGRLMEAFRVVDGHFRTLFETLFQGGSAELRMAEAADPLDAGLDIYACPPGKRLGHLSLMSGGEQALTATALIFAVFLSNPAPVCVLDEVDAPLDDANVDRYCRMLDAMRRRTETRFLVITHNPVTMARMDRLYGVTMHERGVSRLVSVDLERAEALIAAE